jgi:hypothetical protein
MYDDLAGSGDLLREAAPPDDAGAIRFRRERDLGDVVNVTFRFLRDNGRELGRGFLVIVGPAALVAAFAGAWAQAQMERAFSVPPGPSDPTAVFGSSGYLTWLGITLLLAVLTQLLIQSVVLGYVERYRRGEAGTITPARLWEATRAALVRVTTTTLILVGLLFASAFVWIVPILGFLLWFAGAVYLVPVVALLYVERVVEGDGFWDGFEATRGLVSGRWAQTFGLLFVVGLVVFGIALVLSIPSLLVGAVFSFNTLEGGGALRLGALAVSALFGVLVYAAYAVPVAATAFQYFSLVERKEGTGLFREVNALARAPAERQEAPGAPAWRPAAEPPAADAPAADVPAERGFRGGGFFDEGRAPGHAR